jgi:hypothetical protein
MSVTLTYQSTSIVLRNPDFGNQEVYEQRRINRKTRGGDLQIYRNPIWPQTNTFKYTISNLKEEEKQAFLNFLRLSLGQEITMIDYEGRSWTGFISAPNEETSEQTRKNNVISFEFQRTNYA